MKVRMPILGTWPRRRAMRTQAISTCPRSRFSELPIDRSSNVKTVHNEKRWVPSGNRAPSDFSFCHACELMSTCDRGRDIMMVSDLMWVSTW